ncbi:His-Xaa-Ser system protein HxsD [Akkermansiaceae bacterium]|nr:His-Xaa-Ser system protein HxsD [Akkermansiaceae bacterium]
MARVSFPVDIATIDSIHRALYRVADKCSWDIAEDKGSWVVDLKPGEGVDDESVMDSFKEHVLDYGLREKVRAETEQVRSLLLAHAFSAVNTED